MGLGSYDGVWYTEHNGTRFVIVSQILMEWGPFFVYQDNVWRTLPPISDAAYYTLARSIRQMPASKVLLGMRANYTSPATSFSEVI